MERARIISFVLLCVVVLSGCGANLRPDKSLPAEQSNYQTAEFYACGSQWHGLGYCVVPENADLNEVALNVQGYYKGSVKFASNCGGESQSSLRYSKNQKIPFYIPNKAKESCGISFVVSPEYPNEEEQPIVINSFEGHLYIRVVKSGQSVTGFISKVAQGPEPTESISLPSGELTQARAVFKSDLCGVNYDQNVPSKDGSFTIHLKELLPYVDLKTCVINGALISDAGATRILWFISGYDTKFTALPVPKIAQDSSFLSVEGDDNVSIIALDDVYIIDRIAKFKFDASKGHTLRLLTVGGRSVIGNYSEGKWKWMQ